MYTVAVEWYGDGIHGKKITDWFVIFKRFLSSTSHFYNDIATENISFFHKIRCRYKDENSALKYMYSFYWAKKSETTPLLVRIFLPYKFADHPSINYPPLIWDRVHQTWTLICSKKTKLLQISYRFMLPCSHVIKWKWM